MRLKNLKEIQLLVISKREKNPNGTYKDLYSILDKYNVVIKELNDEISVQEYGANIVNMLKISSPLQKLEKLLYVKVNNENDNISKYKIRINGIDYRIKAVKMSGIDIERY